MKTYFKNLITYSLLFLVTSVSFAQKDFQGKAYYMSKTTMDLNQFGGRELSPDRKKQIEERMKSFLEKEFTLTFNKEESIYKEEEVLEASAGGGRGFGFASSFTGGPKYKNVKTKELLQDQEFFGKQFLIKDDLSNLEWKMEGETKQIGNYTVFKATAVKPVTGFDFSSFRPRGRGANGEEEDKKEEENKEPKTVDVVAWYTMQIPVNQGPDDYWGLPGLILEVNAGNTVILCTKVVINPKDKGKIDKPEKGEVVTQQEYTEITTKKMEEFRNNRGRGRGGNRGGRRN